MEEQWILIKYFERNIWEFEQWTRIKCVPFTSENHDRVKKYVKALNNATEINFWVYYKVISGDSTFISFYLKRELKKIYPLPGPYKEPITIKVYRKGELLPHEAALKTSGDLHAYKHFGEHYDNEEIIGENIE